MKQKILQENTLSFENLSKNFKQGANIISVLNNLTFIFKSNHTYAITGISGVGKSTVLHLLAGLESPTNGSIFFNDKNINKFSKNQKQDYLQNILGLIFQYPYLINELSVIENIMLKGLISGKSYEENLELALNLLDKVDLKSKANSYPTALSGGQQQRVSLARALFTRPKFLIADEPTAHLDDASKKVITNLLLECQEAWQMGLIIATHDPLVSNMMQTKIEITDYNFKILDKVR